MFYMYIKIHKNNSGSSACSNRQLMQRKEAKDNFYDMLQRVTEIPRRDMIMMMRDWNATIRAKQEGEDDVVGQHRLGEE